MAIFGDLKIGDYFYHEYHNDIYLKTDTEFAISVHCGKKFFRQSENVSLNNLPSNLETDFQLAYNNAKEAMNCIKKTERKKLIKRLQEKRREKKKQNETY